MKFYCKVCRIGKLRCALNQVFPPFTYHQLSLKECPFTFLFLDNKFVFFHYFCSRLLFDIMIRLRPPHPRLISTAANLLDIGWYTVYHKRWVRLVLRILKGPNPCAMYRVLYRGLGTAPKLSRHTTLFKQCMSISNRAYLPLPRVVDGVYRTYT